MDGFFLVFLFEATLSATMVAYLMQQGVKS
jgi:hypothetical protein